MSVDASGGLKEVIQNFSYAENSGVHGMALDRHDEYLYSADDTGDKLWTHKIDKATGKVTQVDVIAAHSAGADPRHVTVHPEGKYLYTVLEAANQLAVYTIDPVSHKPKFEKALPLIPKGMSREPLAIR